MTGDPTGPADLEGRDHVGPFKFRATFPRVFGLSLLFYALWYLVYGVSTVLGAVSGCAEDFKIAYFISGFLFLISSVYLLRGAPHIARFAYPPDRKQTPSAALSPPDT